MASRPIAGARLPDQCEAPDCLRLPKKRAKGLALCAAHIQRLRKFGSFSLPVREPKPQAKCSVEGCDRHSRTRSGALCETHYYRRYRTGHVELLKRDIPLVQEHTHGYLLDYAPDHPLGTRGRRNRVYQHRRVYYEANGDGPFACHWCGIEVTWATMHVDHVDADRKNNSLSNLVASCPACNVQRGQAKMAVAVRDKVGVQVTAFGITRCISEWARVVGLGRACLTGRLNAGWSAEKALTLPSRKAHRAKTMCDAAEGRRQGG